MGQIKVTKAPIEGLYVIEPTVHGDDRGYFMETYNLNDMIYSARASISLLSRSRFCLIFSSSIISFTFISLV
mgnify:CR=1 FL=1